MPGEISRLVGSPCARRYVWRGTQPWRRSVGGEAAWAWAWAAPGSVAEDDWSSVISEADARDYHAAAVADLEASAADLEALACVADDAAECLEGAARLRELADRWRPR